MFASSTFFEKIRTIDSLRKLRGVSLTICAATAFAAALALALPAKAATFQFTANLDGSQESTPVVTQGSGFATVIYDDVFQLLTVDLTFQGLTGTTTDAHIHCCAPPGVNASVRLPFLLGGFPLGVTAGSFFHVFNLNVDLVPTITLADFVAGLFGGQAYVNIHTSFRAGGEIRGQLAEVPVPSALILFASGLGALGLLACRRKQHAAA